MHQSSRSQSYTFLHYIFTDTIVMAATTRGACIFTTILFLLISVALAKDHAHGNVSSYLKRGSSFSIKDSTTTTTTILFSPNGAFACGFYRVATNAFTFSVWFNGSAAKTVAWTANRDTPVNGRGSRLTFRRGGLCLHDYNGKAVWSTNTTATRASRAQILDTCDLVVVDPDGQPLWRSFDSPTDTLLPSQPMARNTRLVSASARGLLYSGFYTFYFDSDNQLKLIYNGPEASSIYWPDPFNKPWENNRTTYNRSRQAILHHTGQFASSDDLEFEASDLGDEVMRRLTLDYDGNLRLYSLNTASGKWSVSWMAFSLVCDIHGLCGKNSLCKYIPRPQCSCLEGFEVVDASDWSKGCRRKTANREKQRRHKANITSTQDFSFRKLADTDFYGYDFIYAEHVPVQKCRHMCLDNADCQAFGYCRGKGKCYLKVYLFNGKNFPNQHNDIYLKVPKGVLSSSKSDSSVTHACKAHEEEADVTSQMLKDGSSKFKFGYFLSSALTLLFTEVTLIIAGCWFVYQWERRPEITDEGYMIISSQFRIFSYKELRAATKCFQEELGSGGSGAVYKGVLDDGRKVAVKKLKDAVQGEQEFRSELSVVGTIYQMNLVRMWGFCVKRTHRLLVSELIENGSLATVLFDCQSVSRVLQWGQRYNIALGVAKGLAYLYHECLEWIVHCDVKPENILLDKDFEPKIADFGLVKLVKRGSSAEILSRVHGFRGYIAPEWALNLPITGKADVYSYGVVLLELVKGVRVSGWVVEGGEEVEMAVRCSTEILKALFGYLVYQRDWHGLKGIKSHLSQNPLQSPPKHFNPLGRWIKRTRPKEKLAGEDQSWLQKLAGVYRPQTGRGIQLFRSYRDAQDSSIMFGSREEQKAKHETLLSLAE